MRSKIGYNGKRKREPRPALAKGGNHLFSGFTFDTIKFFLDIRFHNEKSFMQAHHAEYIRTIQEPFYAFIEAISPQMLKIDPDFETRPYKCLARIYRDTRFTKDKSPYRDHLWLAFRKAATPKDGLPFFWFEMGPEAVGWGVGIWGENREAMDAFRRRLAARPDDFLFLPGLVQANGFALGGAEFKRLEVPPGLPDALRPLYVKREIYFGKMNTKMDWVYSPDIVTRVARDFKCLTPVYQLLTGCAEEALNALEKASPATGPGAAFQHD